MYDTCSQLCTTVLYHRVGDLLASLPEVSTVLVATLSEPLFIVTQACDYWQTIAQLGRFDCRLCRACYEPI